MKFRDIVYFFGFRPTIREYGFQTDFHTLQDEGEVKFARWLHPSEGRVEFSQGMISMLRTFLREGDVAIDIGAHIGDSTIPIALAVGKSGRVFALEPNPYAFKVLEVNSSLNKDKTNIHPLMFAATPEDGEFEFEYSDGGFCNGGLHEGIGTWKHGHFMKLKVSGINLVKYLKTNFPDDYQKVRYIKIDTEGFDRTVVKSLKELLVSNRPFIKTEIYKHLSAKQRLGYIGDLKELGYRIYKINNEEDYHGMELVENDVLRWKHFDIFAVPAAPDQPPA